jgi:Sec-independent protein secretion pathway component TatC
MMALPMYLLFEVGVMGSRILLRDKLAERKADAQSDEDAAG